MLHKIVQQQCEEFDHYLYEEEISIEKRDRRQIKRYLLSSHISLIQSEIERKKGVMKNVDDFKNYDYLDNDTVLHIGYNQAIQEDITYLEKELEEIKKIV